MTQSRGKLSPERKKQAREDRVRENSRAFIWPATPPWGESRGWPLAGTVQTVSWAGKSGGSTCSCAPNCPGDRQEEEHREGHKRHIQHINLFLNAWAYQQVLGVKGRKHMNDRLTAYRPQRKHRKDFFCLHLWYWRLLALTSHERPVRHM